MSKFRVLFMIPTPMLRGGMESMMMALIRHFDHALIQVDVLQTHVHGYGDGVFDEEIKSYGGQVYYIPSERFYFSYRRGIRHLLKQNRYDVVHCHFLDDRSYIPLQIAKKCGVPVRIAHVHNSKHIPGRNWLNRILATLVNRSCEKKIGQVATGFFACSHPAAKDFLSARNIDQSGVMILPNAIDLPSYSFKGEKRAFIRQQLGIPEDAFVLGLVARLRLEQKNQLFLLAIQQILAKKHADSYLVLVGKGPDEKTIKETILKDNIPHVILVDQDVAAVDYYHVFDAFVMPSFYEGFPVSLVEATANGLPCFVSLAIPKEAGFARNITFLSLSDGPEKWANALWGAQRGDYQEALIQNGFDIAAMAKKVQDCYLAGLKR